MLKFLHSKIIPSLSAMLLCLILFSQATMSAHAEAPPPVPPQTPSVEMPAASNLLWLLRKPGELSRSLSVAANCDAKTSTSDITFQVSDLTGQVPDILDASHLFVKEMNDSLRYTQNFRKADNCEAEEAQEAQDAHKFIMSNPSNPCEAAISNIAPTGTYLVACFHPRNGILNGHPLSQENEILTRLRQAAESRR